MNDNVIFEIIWADNDLLELLVNLSSDYIKMQSRYYTSKSFILDLYNKLDIFLKSEDKNFEWSSGERDPIATPLFTLKFLKSDNRGHVLIEVFAEIDDDSIDKSHNCSFFIRTEVGLLDKFCGGIIHFCDGKVGNSLRLY